MAVRISIPTPLRPYAENARSVEVEGRTVGEALAALTHEHAGLRRHLYDDAGKLRNFVSVFVNERDIRRLDGEATPLGAGDTLTIVPSVAGGNGPGSTQDRIHAAQEAIRQRGQRQGPFTHEEVRRYSRHLILPEVGVEGQAKLKDARVLLVGVGGLGSPMALYLAAAGVGTLGLVDFDVVDESNLHRQVLHDSDLVGVPKLESARRRIEAINPHVAVEPFETRLSSANALEIFRNFDIVADGTDNFPTRYLVNDACVLSGKPNVYGSIFRFEGQVSVFAHGDGPCYRCLYPEPPPPGLVPSCAEGGVLGVLPGVVGLLQATEVIKLILGKGDSLAGRLLLFDALAMKFRELRLERDPACPVCGPNPTVRELIDYEAFCGVGAEPEITGLPEMTVTELRDRRSQGDDPFILDVREPEEFDLVRLDGAVLIPLGELPRRVGELPTDREMVVHCRTGQRSAKAIEFLRGVGFRKIWNLKGGIKAWAEEIDPTLPVY